VALIVAIEPNREQAAQIATIARGRIGAELVLADSAERALRELGDRIPDLILTPQLLSPRDDAAITNRLRELGDGATHVQTLTIPALATEQPRVEGRARGLLSALRRQKPAPSAGPGGCAPDVFAEQIAVYLERALEARAAADHAPHVPVVAPVLEPVFEPLAVEPLVVEPRFEPPALEPRFESPAYEPRFETPAYEPRFETPPAHEPPIASPALDPITQAPAEETVAPPSFEWQARIESTVTMDREADPFRVEPVPVVAVEAANEREETVLLQAVRVDEANADLTAMVEAIAEPTPEPELEVVPALAVAMEPAVVVPVPEPVPVPEITVEIVERPRAAKPAKPAPKKRKKQAAQKDDWSFFDPDETRFAALIARLDEITRSDAVGHS
jgi:CheY-like chemotaxis protein